MTLLPALPITIPLAGAVLCMLARKHIGLQKVIALITSVVILLTSLLTGRGCAVGSLNTNLGESK